MSSRYCIYIRVVARCLFLTQLGGVPVKWTLIVRAIYVPHGLAPIGVTAVDALRVAENG